MKKHLLNIIKSPLTTLGGIICLTGLIMSVKGKSEVGLALIGAGTTLIGLFSKDNTNA